MCSTRRMDRDPEATAVAFARLVAEVAALPDRKPRLWCLTSGVREAASVDRLGGSPLWGMGRVAASEHPEFWGGVVDVPAGPLGEESATLLLDLLPLRPQEPVLSLADGTVQVPRLVPSAPAADEEPFGCRADGTYLITGGLGVLGLELAEHLAQRGARRIVLLGRTPLPPRPQWSDEDRRVTAVRRLESAGVTVVTLAVDITDREATRRALERLDLPPVRGVVHAAGTVHSAMLHRLEADALREVMRPKVEGARVLHELFPPGATDFFVLFSSAGPLLGLPGQERTPRPTPIWTLSPPTGDPAAPGSPCRSRGPAGAGWAWPPRRRRPTSNSPPGARPTWPRTGRCAPSTRSRPVPRDRWSRCSGCSATTGGPARRCWRS